jgi:hypothetical protein
MKKSTLLNLSSDRDYVLIKKENGFKMDFSGERYFSTLSESEKIRQTKKKSMLNILLLLFVFFFTNFLFAQAPACNLSGPLKAEPFLGRVLKTPLKFSAEVINDKPNTVYKWSFKTNNSGAKLVSRNGRRTVNVNPGRNVGSFTIQLTVTNVGANGQNESCTCTQSVTVYKN